MTAHPIPDAALDDRLAIVGKTGSGKTYASSGAVERLLEMDRRVIIVDPLGVWWGLRLMPDGVTPSGFDTVIFGGARGDLAISEHAGAVIGETVAKMSQSCIVDLSGIGTKAGERRFMAAFLTSLYRNTPGDPVHVIFDEADILAPQRLEDKEGDAAKLLGMMQTIVRRGRVKGFIPWVITQRPAVLSKDILSQADGLIAMKLPAPQDRAAIGAWIEGQADRDRGKEILAALPSKKLGEGVIWIPGRDILADVMFPKKHTYDSSRTPKRGEVRAGTSLAPLDLGALKERLATIVSEARANDPRVLKAEIARLKAESGKHIAAPDTAALEAAEQRGYQSGYKTGHQHGHSKGFSAAMTAVTNAVSAIPHQYDAPAEPAMASPVITGIPQSTPVRLARPPAPVGNGTTVGTQSGARPSSLSPGEAMPGPHRKLLTVLAQFSGGRTKKQLAILAGYAHNGGAFGNTLSNLRSRGWAEGGPNRITITVSGLAALGPYDSLPAGAQLREYWYASLESAPAKLLRVLCDRYPRGMSKQELADATGYEASGGAFGNALSRLRAMELATGYGSAPLRASDDLCGDIS